MHTHLRAGAPLTGVPALSLYSLSNDFKQSITKIKRLFFILQNRRQGFEKSLQYFT